MVHGPHYSHYACARSARSSPISSRQKEAYPYKTRKNSPRPLTPVVPSLHDAVLATHHPFLDRSRCGLILPPVRSLVVIAACTYIAVASLSLYGYRSGYCNRSLVAGRWRLPAARCGIHLPPCRCSSWCRRVSWPCRRRRSSRRSASTPECSAWYEKVGEGWDWPWLVLLAYRNKPGAWLVCSFFCGVSEFDLCRL